MPGLVPISEIGNNAGYVEMLYPFHTDLDAFCHQS
jgi:hypothetical protein